MVIKKIFQNVRSEKLLAIKSTPSERIFRVFNFLFMLMLCFVMLYPIWYVLLLSFNDTNIINNSQVTIYPRSFTLLNYRIALKNNDLVNAYLITILRTTSGASLSVYASAAVAYSLSQKHLILRRTFLNILIVTMYFSGGLIPLFLLIKHLGLYNNFLVFILPGMYGAWNIIIMKTFFMNLSVSIMESAKIDGANDIKIFHRIVLPMSMPMIATFLLFSAVAHWNDWFTGEIYIRNNDLLPLQTVLMRLIVQLRVSQLQFDVGAVDPNAKNQIAIESIKMACIIISTAPILAVYPFLQKYFVKGIMIGSLKE